MIRMTPLAAVVLAFLSVDCHAIEIRRWARVPLTVPLIVGQERVIFVDRNVRVAVPTAIGEALSVQSAGGAVYLRASATLDRTRLQLQDADTGTLILVDITASAAEPGRPALEPIRIIDASTASPLDDDDDITPGVIHRASSGTGQQSTATPIAVVLTRYAAQSLFAPLRTIEPVDGIAQVSTRGLTELETLMPALPVRAQALAAWRLDELWVTAIELTNTCDRRLNLDPRELMGDFEAATFQHRDLGPAGDDTDTTVVYLITSGHGLRGAVLPSISGVDASKNLPLARQAGAQP